MGRPKKIVEAIKEVVAPKVVKTKEEVVACANCNDSGMACSTCAVPFVDTFK